MPNISQEYRTKIKELSGQKHLMNETFESWPRRFHGPDDRGGFIESMEFALAHDYPLSPKRMETIDKMYAKYILGAKEKEEKPRDLIGDCNLFEMGRAGGRRAPEGWRITVDKVVVGTPITREHAYIIGAWLKQSLPALEHYFKNGQSFTAEDGVQEATVEQVEADTKQAEQIEEI